MRRKFSSVTLVTGGLGEYQKKYGARRDYPSDDGIPALKPADYTAEEKRIRALPLIALAKEQRVHH